MIRVTRLLLDILKPHHPDVIEFSKVLAEQGAYRVRLKVVEMDDKTETLEVEIGGDDIDCEQLREAISGMGASLHSIDAVEVDNDLSPPA